MSSRAHDSDDVASHCRPIRPITDAEFHRIRDIVREESGIHLTSLKRELVTARLSRRIRSLGLTGFREYTALVASSADERTEMLDRILTNETRFFREPHQFDYLETTIIPRWIEEARAGNRSRTIRVWSAGCSTGQEPATIAMVLLAGLPQWTIEILASDLSTRALTQAASGLFPVEKASEIPERYRREFMLRGVASQLGSMRTGSQIRSAVRFRRINLNASLPEAGPFDAIFCRNVLIYFDSVARRSAIDRFTERLPQGGYLFLGHSESLINATQRLRPVAPSIYRREDSSRG